MSVIEIAAASLLKREDSYLKLPGKGNMCIRGVMIQALWIRIRSRIFSFLVIPDHKS